MKLAALATLGAFAAVLAACTPQEKDLDRDATPTGAPTVSATQPASPTPSPTPSPTSEPTSAPPPSAAPTLTGLFIFSGVSFDAGATAIGPKDSPPRLLTIQSVGPLQSGGQSENYYEYADTTERTTRGGAGVAEMRGRWATQLKFNVPDARVVCYSQDTPVDNSSQSSSYNWSVANILLDRGTLLETSEPGTFAIDLKMREDSRIKSNAEPSAELHIYFVTDDDDLYTGYASTSGASRSSNPLRVRISADYRTISFSGRMVIGSEGYKGEELTANLATVQGRITCADVPRKIRGFNYPAKPQALPPG